MPTAEPLTHDEEFELALLRIDNAAEDVLMRQQELRAVVAEAEAVLVKQQQ